MITTDVLAEALRSSNGLLDPTATECAPSQPTRSDVMHNRFKSARTLRPAGFVPPMLATEVSKPPNGDMWLHEIKYDGYRIQVVKSDDRVRLLTRRRGVWTKRYPCVVQAATRIKAASCVIDGELVVAHDRGVANFGQRHSRKHDAAAMLWAFDLLALDGEDLRRLPLVERKARLAKLLKRSPQFGIAFSEQLEGDGAIAFECACAMGVEGIVSKLCDSRYVSGRSKSWLKVKNRGAPGVLRFQERE